MVCTSRSRSSSAASAAPVRLSVSSRSASSLSASAAWRRRRELSRLLATRASSSRALREEAERLDTLNRTGAALAAELDLERLVQTITDAAVKLTDAKFGAFFYNARNEAGESYTLYTLAGAARDAFADFPMPRFTAVF